MVNDNGFPELWSAFAGETRSLHKRAADRLRDAIVTGALPTGSRLIEQDISRQLAVSRGPIREAIRELEQEGLVRSFPHRGAVVVGVTEAEVHQLLIPIRVVIETFAYREAKQLLTADDHAELERLVADMRTGDLQRVVEADISFHELVLERSGQPHALQLWRTILPRIRAYFYRHGGYSDTSKFADEHATLHDALRNGSRRELEKTVREHIEIDWLETE